MDHATVVREGSDVTIVACGEMVYPAKKAAELLAEEGIQAEVLDMYCLKPFDSAAVLRSAEKTRAVVTVEEHAPFGGLGAMVAQAVSANCPKKVVEIALPDGWHGYDPTFACEAGEDHLRFAVGQDAADCRAERGVFRGVADQTLHTEMRLNVRNG